MDDALSPDLIPELAARVRHERLQRGWDLSELARRAEVSRTTLYHLEKGHTRRIRSSTVKTIADAFEMSVESLVSSHRAAGTRQGSEAAAFDRATNPAVADVVKERPAVFAGWSPDEWDELYSQFGVGGPLTPLGVLSAAEAINQKRETIRQLHVVLDTHLRDVARAMIETFYKMVQAKAPPRADTTSSQTGMSVPPETA
jgi:transcriptional regulator with XRE-family HTH domain